MSYKRAIAKSMKAKEFTKSVSDQTRRRRHKEGAVGSKQAPPSSEENAPYSPSMGLAGATDSQESTPYSPGVDLGIFLGGDDRDSLTGTPGGGKSETPSSQNGKRVADSKDFAASPALKHKQESTDKGNDAKKMKLEKSSSNGFSSIVKSHSMNEFGGGGSESVIMVTQLRGQLESLKRQLQEKERNIIDRDKKITELKAQNASYEMKMRKKIETVQQQSQEIVNGLKEKNRELTQQISKLSKPSKKS